MVSPLTRSLSASLIIPLILVGIVVGEEPKAGDAKADEEGFFLAGDKQTCKVPPLRITKPGDSWQFIDLEKMKANDLKEGRDIGGYQSLRFRLYYGAARANIFVYALVDSSVYPEPQTPQQIAALQVEHQLKRLKQLFKGGMKIKKQGKAKISKRVGLLFEVEGRFAEEGDLQLIMKAVVFRPQDKVIVTLALEGSASKGKDLRKAFKTLLKKARI